LTNTETTKDDNKKKKEDDNLERIIIQCDLQEENVSISIIDKKFKGTGLNLDKNYGPLLINPKLHRYVVRGFADLNTKTKISKLTGVKVFADSKVKPIKKKSYLV